MSKETCARILLVTLCLAVAACKGDSAEGSGGGTGSTEAATATDASTSMTTTGGEVSHEICDRYLQCIGATLPEALPAAQAGYGKNGTCWDGGPDAAQLCIDGCRTGLEQNHKAFPDEPKCNVCQSDADCEVEGESCFEGGCGSSACGNSVIEEGEVCDGQPDCDSDCQGPAACNPITNGGCSESSQCWLTVDFDSRFRTQCLAAPKAMQSVGDNCADGLEDTRCGVGQFCPFDDLQLAGCTFEYCCTRFCDISAPASCPEGNVCKPYQDVLHNAVFVEEALDFVGLCVAG